MFGQKGRAFFLLVILKWIHSPMFGLRVVKTSNLNKLKQSKTLLYHPMLLFFASTMAEMLMMMCMTKYGGKV